MDAASLPPLVVALAVPLEVLSKLTLLLALAMLAAHLLRRRSAASRHLAWTLGLAAALLLPLTSSVMPAVHLSLPVFEPPQPARIVRIAEPQAPRAALEREAGAISPARASASRASDEGSLLLQAITLTWSLGVAVLLLRFAASWRRAHRLVGGATTVDGREARSLAAELGASPRVRLAETSEAAVPMTHGALRPVVLVPLGFSGWPAERRHEVLLHELAHVRRHDWLVQVLAQFACAALWFHPLVRLAARRLRDEAEQAADDLVLQHGARPSAYAAHLVDLVRSLQHAPGSPAMTLSMAGGPFDSRIRAILDAARSRGPVTARLRAGLAGVMGLALLALSVVNAGAEPRHETPWQHIRRAIGSHVDHARSHFGQDDPYSRGLSLHGEGDHDAAIELFERSIANGVLAGASSYNIACAHALSGRTDEALAWLYVAAAKGFELSKYLHRDSDLASLRGDARFIAFAEAHVSAGDRAGLLARLDALKQQRSLDAGDWVGLALDFHFAGLNREAIAAADRAMALKPSSAATLYNIACARSLTGDRDGAFDALRLAIEAGWSNVAHARTDSDLATLRGDRFDDLLAEAALLDAPRSNGVLGWIFGGDSDGSDWHAAVRRHEQFVAAHPASGAGWFQLGFSALRAGDTTRAIEAFERCRALDHRRDVAAYDIACAHAVAGRTNDAFDWLRLAQDEGFDVASHASGDEDLVSLRRDARFAQYQSHGVRQMLRRIVEY